MINFNDVAKENIKKHNPSCPQIPNHPYRILLIAGKDVEKRIYYIL